jgi:hypothetical protein
LTWSDVARGEQVGTLSLDGLSFVSFDGTQNLPIPAGSVIRFRFGEVADGSVTFTIDPEDAAILPIPAGEDGATIQYRLASGATGTARKIDGAPKIEFTATIAATMQSASGGGTHHYALLFTTETTSASNAAQTEQIEVEGMRVVPGPNYVQLVGAATNKPDAFPQPGTTVYAVLSGSFDWFPSLP